MSLDYWWFLIFKCLSCTLSVPGLVPFVFPASQVLHIQCFSFPFQIYFGSHLFVCVYLILILLLFPWLVSVLSCFAGVSPWNSLIASRVFKALVFLQCLNVWCQFDVPSVCQFMFCKLLKFNKLLLLFYIVFSFSWTPTLIKRSVLHLLAFPVSPAFGFSFLLNLRRLYHFWSFDMLSSVIVCGLSISTLKTLCSLQVSPSIECLAQQSKVFMSRCLMSVRLWMKYTFTFFSK